MVEFAAGHFIPVGIKSTEAENIPGGINSSDARFNALLGTVSERPAPPKPASTPWALPGQKKPYGSLDITARRVALVIDRTANPVIADTMIKRVEAFRRELESAASANQPKKG